MVAKILFADRGATPQALTGKNPAATPTLDSKPLSRHRHRGALRLAEIDSELRKPLSADSEERATDLENHDALEGVKNSEIQEIHQIQGTLKRIAEGTYGVCAKCGADIDPKRLKVLPIATIFHALLELPW